MRHPQAGSSCAVGVRPPTTHPLQARAGWQARAHDRRAHPRVASIDRAERRVSASPPGSTTRYRRMSGGCRRMRCPSAPRTRCNVPPLNARCATGRCQHACAARRRSSSNSAGCITPLGRDGRVQASIMAQKLQQSPPASSPAGSYGARTPSTTVTFGSIHSPGAGSVLTTA